MDSESLLTIGRVLERLLIVVIGGLSLGMGWHLYVKGVEKRQVAEIQHDKTVIRLKDVGPGAFFAVVGALVLVVALLNSLIFSRPLSPDKRPAASSASGKLGYFKYGSGASSKQSTADVVTAITTVTQLVAPHNNWEDTPWQRRGVEQAMTNLSLMKAEVLSAEFPQFNAYLEVRVVFQLCLLIIKHRHRIHSDSRIVR